MQITLDHHTPLYIASQAIRQCWQSQEKSDTCFHTEGTEYIMYTRSETWDQCNTCHQDVAGGIKTGPNDRALIDRIGNKFKHASTLEHLSYNFTIEGVSRALLQELARHRISSFSVKSSRYTLGELKNEEPIMGQIEDRMALGPIWSLAGKYLVRTGIDEVDWAACRALYEVQKNIKAGIGNDKAKYGLPESYKTSLAWTINARSLQNFLSLRSSKAALWEIRDLAQAVYDALPADHTYLFTHCVEGSIDG